LAQARDTRQAARTGSRVTVASARAHRGITSDHVERASIAAAAGSAPASSAPASRRGQATDTTAQHGAPA